MHEVNVPLSPSDLANHPGHKLVKGLLGKEKNGGTVSIEQPWPIVTCIDSWHVLLCNTKIDVLALQRCPEEPKALFSPLV